MAAPGQNSSQVAEIFKNAPPVGSSVVPGQSAPLHFGQPGSVPWDNAKYALDSRQQKPSTWDEVNLLQEALKPSIRSFARVTSRSPPFIPGSPWLSYASQLDILQRQSDRCWSADQRPGAPPRLAGLGAWSGGILMVGDAKFLITEEMTERFINAKLRGYRHRDGSPSWYQEKFFELGHRHVQTIQLEADARRKRLEAQAVEGRGQQDASQNITATLDSIVARDPERYLAWLSNMGYFYFTMYDHNPYGFSWEDWCVWKAPRSFEASCKPAPAVDTPAPAVDRPTFGPGSIDRTKYGPPGDRSSITLEEARKGNKRAMEFAETIDGLEFSPTEKAQYFMIGGKATSREAAAHYHGIRGDDVWLTEPIDSVKEAYENPGRQREAEVEASFRSQAQALASQRQE